MNFALSETQKLIWLDQAISGNPARYNIGGYLYLDGDLSPQLLETSIRCILFTQEVYSYCFTSAGNTPACHIRDAAQVFALRLIDFTKEDDPNSAALSWMEEDFQLPFLIEDNYLFRFLLLRTAEREHYLYTKIHHLIGDGWSFKLSMDQLSGAYDSLLKGSLISKNLFKYRDYIEDDLAYHSSISWMEDRDYWTQEYTVPPEDIFRERQTTLSYNNRANAHTLLLGKETRDRLLLFARENKVSLFHVFLGILTIYFSRTSGQSRIPVALPVLNRSKKAYKQTAGVFMNLICPIFEVDADITVEDLLASMKRKMLQCLRHQKFQYGSLVKEIDHHLSGKALYQVRVSYEEFDFNMPVGDLKGTVTALSNYQEDDPLSIYIRDYHNDSVDVRFVYNNRYFEEQDVRVMASCIEFIAATVPEQGPAAIKEILLFPDDEKDKIFQLSRGKLRQWTHRSFLDLWMESVRDHADRISISAGSDTTTYRELHHKACALAAYLQQLYTPKETLVVLLLPRTDAMVAGMLGCMLGRFMYMPVDPEEPIERLAILMQSRANALLLTCRHLGEKLLTTGIPCLFIEESSNSTGIPASPPEILVDPGDPCYILATSGSTGMPKAVEVSHGALLNYISHFKEYFTVSQQDVVLQQASVAFDTSVEEIFPILAAGGRLHIQIDRRELMQMSKTIRSAGITILSSTPMVLQFLDKAGPYPSLRLVISGGDSLIPAQIGNFMADGIPVFNTYGPTESTVCVSYASVKAGQDPIPIGKPIANCNVYVMDKCRRLQPPGREGEIYLGGAGLASGYYKDPILTNELFGYGQDTGSERLYKTGDYGRYHHNGDLYFLGRKDNQVKIRGIRIETGELERMLSEHPMISGATVMSYSKNDPLLVAFITLTNAAQNTGLEERELRTYVRRYLPAYLAPAHFIIIREMPLTVQGKIDEKKLELLFRDIQMRQRSDEIIAPVTAIERSLIKIWERLLQKTSISMVDNFFSMGGDSLKAVALINAIADEFSIELSIAEIFSHPEANDMSGLIRSRIDEKFDVLELC